MDENRGNGGATAYFDNISGGSGTGAANNSQYYGMPPVQPPGNSGGERGSGKGLFVGGLITGLAAALLIVGICYLGLYVQNAVDDRQNGASEVSLGQGSVIEIGRASCRERV